MHAFPRLYQQRAELKICHGRTPSELLRARVTGLVAIAVSSDREYDWRDDIEDILVEFVGAWWWRAGKDIPEDVWTPDAVLQDR